MALFVVEPLFGLMAIGIQFLQMFGGGSTQKKKVQVVFRVQVKRQNEVEND